MSKKVVVISASLRANSNSEALAKEFVKGTEAAGHEVEYLSLIFLSTQQIFEP